MYRVFPKSLSTALATLSLLAMGFSTLVHAQTGPRMPPSRPRVPAEAEPLLSADETTWMAGVAALRSNPRARELVLQALASRPSSPRRWRLAYHLIEWGQAQDAATLSALLDSADGQERRALLGALTALYPRPLTPLDTAGVVKELTFVPKDQPAPFAPDAAGKFVVSDLVIQAYHQDNLPVRLVERMMGLKGRAYESRTGLADAMQRQLQGRQWADFGERLLAPLLPIPARLSQSGTLQARLTNPAQRPIVLVLTFQCWYGRFEQAPEPRYLWLEPGDTALEEIPVRLIALADPGRVRLFMRFHELNSPGHMDVQKLEIPFRR